MAVSARRVEIARDLAKAVAEAWKCLANDDDVLEPCSPLKTLLEIARSESDRDGVEVNALRGYAVAT